MKKMIKKAAMGGQTKPKVKVTATVTKKPAASAPSPKRYPIKPDEGDNYDQTMKREAEMKKKGIFKMGGKIKKAENGFGMLSVKAKVDNNPGITAADRIAGATMKDKAKMGKAVKKCKYGCK
jgi:hypothetical protein